MTLSLPDVTLVCIDTRDPVLGLEALARSMTDVCFGEVLLFTDASKLTDAPAGMRIVDVRLASVPEYSVFVLKRLAPYLRTSHMLIVQWDGFVLNAAAWETSFLDCDYIGPPWPRLTGPRSVGNGGFSLRSRKLLDALTDPAIEASHPEDVCICHQHRELLETRHGIRFAAPDMAARFGYERGAPTGPTFGFHGLFNFHRVLAPDELDDYLAALPDHLMRGLDAHDLCTTLIARGRLRGAGLIIAARRRLGMHDRRSLRLRWRWQFARWRKIFTSTSASSLSEP